MKRYIKSAKYDIDDIITIYDLISDVRMRVIFVDSLDATNHLTIQGSVYTEYADLSDEELIHLSEAEIHKIKDTKTIVRIAKINRFLLSEAQRTIAETEFWNKTIITKDAVKSILADLRTKKVAYFMPDNSENESFIEDNGISAEDALYAIQHLTVGDYVANTTNTIPKYYGDELIIFEPTRALPLKNGGVIRDTIIYIKIDLNRSKKTGAYLISFHSTKHEDRKPYNNK